MSHPLLPLCSTPKVATRDGYTGANARILLPYYIYGYWFASGQQYTWPGSTLAQDNSVSLGGTFKANTFHKAAQICLGG